MITEAGPEEEEKCETSTNIHTVGTMIQLTRDMWSTGKAVLTDSGFFVLRGIFEMRNRGIYGSALIKRGAIGLGGLI